MINLDFFKAIAAYFIFTILILFGLWIWSNGRGEGRDLSAMKFLRQCPICAFLFFYYRDDLVSACPRCKSYLKKEVE